MNDFLTAGEMARHLNEPLHRVTHILETRTHIKPARRVGIIRLFAPETAEQIRAELDRIDSKRRRTQSPEHSVGVE